MLRKIARTKSHNVGGRYAIIASRYNSVYVEAMLSAAKRVFAAAKAERVQVLRVPGAFEIPVAAAHLIRSASLRCDAIVCLGVILRGETEHAQLIGEAVTTALMQLQVQTGIPIVHEVLLLENKAQAEKRCLEPRHNRGAEAAQTAVEMRTVLRPLATTR